MRRSANGSRSCKAGDAIEFISVEYDDPRVQALRDAYYQTWGQKPFADPRAEWIGAFHGADLVGALGIIRFPQNHEVDITDLLVVEGRWGAVAAYELLNWINDHVAPGTRVIGTVVATNVRMMRALHAYGAKPVTVVFLKEYE